MDLPLNLTDLMTSSCLDLGFRFVLIGVLGLGILYYLVLSTKHKTAPIKAQEEREKMAIVPKMAEVQKWQRFVRNQ